MCSKPGAVCSASIIGDVECVVPAVRPVPLPHAPAGFEGIMNLRGIAVAVLDLRAWFGDAPREIQLDDLLIVLQRGLQGSRCMWNVRTAS